MEGHTGEHQGRSGGRGSPQKPGQGPHHDFQAMGEAGSAHLGLASWNHLTGLWGRVTVCNCLVPGPGVLRARGQGPGVSEPCESLIEEVVGCALWIVGLYL